MVDNLGLRPHACLRAHATKRLPKQVLRSELVLQDRQVVPAVIIAAYAALVLRLMLVTPAVPRKSRASRMPAGPQRFRRHGLSPPQDKTKKATVNAIRVMTVALLALVLNDIDFDFSFTGSAVGHDVMTFCLRRDPHEPLVLAARRAGEPIALYG